MPSIEKPDHSYSIQSLAVPCDDVYLAFTHSRLLTGVEKILVGPWIDCAVTSECFLALSTTYFGVEQREKSIMVHGLSRYGAALQTLHKALADSVASRSFDVLEAVMIMALIEASLTLCAAGNADRR
jgi:hypothetical protein